MIMHVAAKVATEFHIKNLASVEQCVLKILCQLSGVPVLSWSSRVCSRLHCLSMSDQQTYSSSSISLQAALNPHGT